MHIITGMITVACTLLHHTYNGDLNEHWVASLFVKKILLTTNGVLPCCLWLHLETRSLGLGSSELTGSIPEHISVLTNLFYLDLSNSQLVGCIPMSLSLLHLTTLMLSGNSGLRRPDGQFTNLGSYVVYTTCRKSL